MPPSTLAVYSTVITCSEPLTSFSMPRRILAQSNITSGKHKTHLDFILGSFCAHERKMFATSDVSDTCTPTLAYAVKH